MAGSGMAYETVHLNRWVWRALDILESKPQESLELARQAPDLTESIGFFTKDRLVEPVCRNLIGCFMYIW